MEKRLHHLKQSFHEKEPDWSAVQLDFRLLAYKALLPDEVRRVRRQGPKGWVKEGKKNRNNLSSNISIGPMSTN